MEKLVKNVDMHHGLYIDIFPYDNIQLDTFKGKYQIWLIRTLDSFLKYRLKERYATLQPGFERTKAKLKYDLINLLPFSKPSIEKWILKIMTRFNHMETVYVVDLADPGVGILESFIMRRETIDDSIEWEFERYNFPVPRAYDEVLTRHYGDYMTPPDKPNQVSHHNILKVDLENGQYK